MKKLLLEALRLTTVVFVCLVSLGVNTSLAQIWPPIGRHYANSIEVILPKNEEGRFMSQAEIMDINEDGLDDVVFSSDINEFDTCDPENNPVVDRLHIMTRNNAGSLEDTAAMLLNAPDTLISGRPRQLIPADFNGDGRLDLFWEDHGCEGPGNVPDLWIKAQNRLFLSGNDGQLTEVTDTHLPQYMDYTHGSSIADFDGDGDVDIWVNTCCQGPDAIGYPEFGYLLHNDGQGSFTVVADLSDEGIGYIPIVGTNGIFPVTPDGEQIDAQLWSVTIDADGDGDMDLIFVAGRYSIPSNRSNKRNMLFVNDGAGHFELLPGDSWPLSENTVNGQHSLVYDLNGDGLDDMLLHQSADELVPHVLQILISNGDGTFRDETAERYPGGPVDRLTAFQLHDLDGDGHKDLFSHVGGADGKNDIRVNDGEGYFRQLDEDWVQPDWNWVVLDVDGDGGTDFFINGGQGHTLAKMNLPYGAVLDGTSEDDRLIGGAHDNVYRGFAGDDVLDGGLGDDDMDGGDGDDELIGGKGDDWLKPGPGSNTVDGGPGRDLVDYPFSMDDAEILPNEITFISKDDDSVNDQVQNTEYALFTDAATPLPTQQQSAINSLNGVAGLWYDPDLDGEGFNVITTPSGTVIFFYGFNADSERLWLISETLSDDFDFEQVLDLQMYEGINGTFDQPTPPPDGLSVWGQLKMLFDGCNTARFALHGSAGVKTTYQVKLAGITNADCQMQTLSAPSGMAGLWYDPVLNCEGYNVIITETVTVILFYGYAADGERLWLISDTLAGAPAIGETTILQMFVSTDGTFDEPLASSEVLKDWGELEITFNSCGTVIANLTGDDGEKTSNLEKLAGIDQSTCP